MTTPDEHTMSAMPAETAAMDAKVEEILRRGPTGAFAVAGIAAFIVMAIFFVFYFFAYLPRGAVQ